MLCECAGIGILSKKHTSYFDKSEHKQVTKFTRFLSCRYTATAPAESDPNRAKESPGGPILQADTEAAPQAHERVMNLAYAGNPAGS